MKSYWTPLFIIVFSISLSAQDQHFTQFYAAPLTINPALTGAYEGTYRFGGIYRDQWRGALESPYSTFAAMLDVRFKMNRWAGLKDDAAAVGLMFYNDKVTGFDFNTNQIGLSFAYHKSLDQRNTHYLSLGIQGLIGQRNLNYEDLTFNDQYDGTSGYFLDTRENLPVNNFSFSDFSFGLNYAYTPKRMTSIYAGFAMHHVFEPQVTFFETDDARDYEGSTLFRKYSVFASASLPISNKISLLPRLVYQQQGPHMQINAGTNFRFLVNDYSGVALHIGGWVRPVGNYDDSISLDAVIMMFGIEYNNVLMGLSYDANLNDLQTDRNGQGAFEISVAYLGNYDNETILCPKF
jgi:type IX secretion system PorP/SprF family membrane protein